MIARSVAGVAALLILSGSALGQALQGQKVDAAMSSGDVVRGVLVSQDEANVVLQHPVLGTLTIPRANLAGMTVVVDQTPPPPAPVAPPPPPPPPAAPEVKADPESFLDGWDKSIELGINGSDGNSQSLSLRGAFNAKRDTSKTATTAGVSYVYGTQDGDKNLEHGEVNLRNDWKIGSPWRIYAIGKAEYDTFQDWTWRTSLFGGFGYEFINSDKTLLLGRIGAGVTKEFGSSKQRIEPELNLGLDWEHKFDERQKIFATIDYYPSLHRFTDYRANAKAGYEVVVDPVNKLSLKLGLEDRYNSNPGQDKKKNDLLYFATIVYNF
ncbi:MAG TPA: DUF481 domain-containing protein [Phycisphaerales bacterium]|nr:DUF481 domain-containing protein [Phycisphaerales bacterium]